jgi:hypothetical protein
MTEVLLVVRSLKVDFLKRLRWAYQVAMNRCKVRVTSPPLACAEEAFFNKISLKDEKKSHQHSF